ncbi:LacI family DNA-binding transcriptional regulator [Micromonospora endophytica]|uniref:LacI family transcriptional regulator n=1 Tax=Micromonospora endophytica TaxID=515350 RepID=A0A2W2DXI8_9ACTN|nr:LacI family DNA-binding transcriptional regulator [Micromonospora endophytica]PZF97583.1 LacI family transcriptional regulator [Micromonospora endophytica]RIW49528.1 LacI family transcriptional regulator [Micromonospora endophytica]BCJ62582.1 LacI family transcriptional regulator [Micromonospora endophytica]
MSGRGRLPSGQPTIADVARHAGVAVSTVSYVLSGKRAISEVTRNRVLASIRLLGYHPNAGARALASRRANVIALVLPLRTGIQVPVVMQFATAVVTSARRHDHDVLLLTSDEGPAGLRRIAAGALVDGVLVMDVELHDVRVPLLRELGRPSVLIGLPADPGGLTCVDLDFHRAGQVCVEHLASLGHRRVALLGAPPAVYDRGTGFAHRTRAGVLEAAVRHGVDAVALPCAENAAEVQRRVVELFAQQPGISGLVVQNEAAVGPVQTTLSALGRRVPHDVSVVAVCPDQFAEHASPRLTSVPVPAEEIGRQAVSLLMRKLRDEAVPERTLLPPRLTVRDSTAAAPAAAPGDGVAVAVAGEQVVAALDGAS